MPKKILLSESDIPERWYNILPDLPEPPAPYLHPGTLQPMGPADLAPIFPQAIIAQEVSAEPGSRSQTRCARSTRSGGRARSTALTGSRKALDTPAHIYFKYEGVSPAGSHKPNTAVPQAYYNSKEGVKRLTTETGAGQMGVRAGVRRGSVQPRGHRLHGQGLYEQKPYRRAMMETWGATVHASPSNLTNAGRGILADDPDSPAASESRSQKRSKTRPPMTTPSTRWARSSTMSCSTRRSSAWRPRSRWRWRGVPGCRDRMRGGRLELCRPHLSLHRRQAQGSPQAAAIPGSIGRKIR